MARARSFDEDMALDAIMRTFWTHGFRATSVDQLAAAAGVFKGSLHHAFGNKEAMFLVALERYAERFDRRLEGALDEADPVRAVRGFFDAVVERMADPANPRGCLSTYACLEYVDLPPAAATVVADGLDRLVDRLTEHAAEAVRIEALPPGTDPRAQAMLWYALTRGMASVHKVRGDAEEIRRLAAEGLRTLGPGVG